MTKISRKILIIALLTIILLNTFANTIYAAIEINLDKVYLKKIGEADYHLKYYREDGNEYRYLKCSIVGYYDKQGDFNPAYCMNKDLTGAEDKPYNVTINNLLNNNKVWRVIKNGYPYKSAKELGVKNDYNAYAVTKWAVYCMLGESKIEKYKADSEDEEAVAMLSALKKLVKIGKEGTEKQNDNPLKIKKVKDLVEEGEYYSQEYEVTSATDFNTYKINNTKGLSKGSFIANIKGEKQKKFNSNENFKIMISKDTLNKDISAEIEISSECKAYVILEGKTTVTNTQDYVVTAGEFATFTQKSNLEKQTNTGIIKINKIDSETSSPIQGVEFELKDTKGNTVSKAVTDANGIVNFAGLYQGKYKLVETKANENYVITQAEFEVDVEYNKQTEITIKNEPKQGQIKIVKVDKNNNQIKLEGVKFNVMNKDGKVLEEIITNKEGEAITSKYSIKDYKNLYIQEVVTKKEYRLNNEIISVELKADEITSIQIENEIKKGKIKIVKVDKDNNEIKLSGVEFEIYNDKGEIVEKLITDSKGEAISKDLPATNEYIIKEVKTNEQYILNDNEVTLEVEDDKTTEIDIENDHKKGNLKIYKVDEDNIEIGLGNIEFELYSEELQKTIGTYTTNADGEIYIENLRTGTYKLKEKNTNKWYNLINDLEIEVKWNEEIPVTETIVKNELKKGQVKVIKVDKDNNEIKLDSVKFNVMNEKGEILEEIITDKNGEAVTSKYPVRDYKNLYIQEKETKSGYRLNDEIVEVKLNANEVTTVKLENEVKKGRIKVIKVDKDNNNIKLEGVVFNVFNEKNELVDTLTTNKDGEAESKELPITNKYTVKEIKTNKNYNLSEEIIEVELKDGEISELRIENEKKKGKIKVVKIDKDNNEIKLEGVEFDVLDSNGKIVDTIKTNKEGIAKTKELPINEKYIVRETKTLENYVLNNKEIIVKLENEGETTIKIENEKIKGKIKILKISKDYNPITGEKAGTPLENVKFEIYDINNNKIETILTNKDGIAQSKELEKGLYYIKEISTKQNYILNDKIFNIEITENGQIVDLTIENESQKPNIDIEKTGVNEAEIGSQIEYDISVRNTGNTSLDNFIWEDILPSDYIKLTKFQTGTYNQNLKYNLYYKTNLSDNQYILLMEDLSTLDNYEIDFEKELADNEYVTELKLDFGIVDIGFASNENPHIFANIREDIKINSIFENVAKVSGEFNGYKISDNSRWKTKTFKLLPKTGF